MSPSKISRAFTLIELLVVIVVIAILTGMLFTAVQSARRTADRSAASSNLRQISLGIQSYANDNDDCLPGPLDLGQSPRYSTSLSSTLGFRLWKYIGADKPTSDIQEAKLLDNPAHIRFRGTDTTTLAYTSPTYVVNQSVTDDSGVARRPWGYNNPDVDPLRMGAVHSWAGASKLWALQDVDRLNIYTAAGMLPSWYTKLPLTPLHGNVRLVLYFDWHVQPVNASILSP